MKAIRIHKHGSEDVLHIDTLDVPQIQPDEVLVKIKYAALNHLDIFVRNGIPGVPLPLIMGSDGSGIIEEAGSLVQNRGMWKKGQAVILVPFRSCGTCLACSSGNENLCRSFLIPGEHLNGYQAEYVTLPAEYILAKPNALSFQEAAAFPLAFLTAYHMLTRKIRIVPGSWILILGASSGVGSAGIQIAKHYGARVITTIGSESKRILAEDLGAEYILNYEEEPIGKSVRDITGGAGVDIVFEHTGSATWNESLKALKPGGKIVTCGATTGPHVRIDLRSLFIKQQQYIGSTMGTRRDLLELCSLIEDGILRIPIDQVFEMDHIVSAHKHLEINHTFGKVILSVS
jgi:NADPH:quinone reductase-like Zn-dependent oxidoreductase